METIKNFYCYKPHKINVFKETIFINEKILKKRLQFISYSPIIGYVIKVHLIAQGSPVSLLIVSPYRARRFIMLLCLDRTNGKLGHCAGCGMELPKHAGLAYKFDGNTVGCFCHNCLDGKLPIGKRAYKFHTTDEQTTNAKTTKNHTVKVVITNPHTALDTFINFGGVVEKIEDNGDIVVTIENQKACYKVGHFFNEDRLADDYKMVFVNGEPVNNLEEYHKVVKVQG